MLMPTCTTHACGQSKCCFSSIFPCMQMNLKFVNYIKGPWTTGPTTIKIALTVILQFRHLSVHILCRSFYRNGAARGVNRFFSAAGDKKLLMLVGLDISSAFDMMDHNILLRRLHGELGVTSTALVWLQSRATSAVILSLASSECTFHLWCCAPLAYHKGPFLTLFCSLLRLHQLTTSSAVSAYTITSLLMTLRST